METVRWLDPNETAVLLELLGRIAQPAAATTNLATDEVVAEALGR